MGYLICDCLFVCYFFNTICTVNLNKQTIIHHAVAIIAFFLAIRYSVFLWVACFRLLSEASTPFLNMRALLYEIPGMQHSRLYLVNGICAAVVFFACRIAVQPFYLNLIFTTHDDIMRANPVSVFTLLVSGVTLDALNLIWFSKILKGTLKAAAKFHTHQSSKRKQDNSSPPWLARLTTMLVN